MEKDPILVFDRPDFVVRLDEDWIDVDLKKGGKAKLERAIEKDPLLKKTIGLFSRARFLRMKSYAR